MSVSCADPVPDEYAELSDQANMYCIIGQQGIRPHALRLENTWLFGIILEEDYLAGFITFMDTTGHCWKVHDPLGCGISSSASCPLVHLTSLVLFAVMYLHTMTACLTVKGAIMRMSFHGHCRKGKVRDMQDRNPANAGGLRI